ncbi:hypothetical protein JZ751_017079 [Albula glossodonta]|uniref:Uncharacterized protein n=1 Tax=Albula glossodonta TaxID=121402 RepID=A0A8T2NWY9_9TELE|nr:hypothetical protein JZ751_017079 [Albula glossodonta]
MGTSPNVADIGPEPRPGPDRAPVQVSAARSERSRAAQTSHLQHGPEGVQADDSLAALGEEQSVCGDGESSGESLSSAQRTPNPLRSSRLLLGKLSSGLKLWRGSCSSSRPRIPVGECVHGSECVSSRIPVGECVHGSECVFSRIPVGECVPGSVCVFSRIPVGECVPGSECVFSRIPVGECVPGSVCVFSRIPVGECVPGSGVCVVQLGRQRQLAQEQALMQLGQQSPHTQPKPARPQGIKTARLLLAGVVEQQGDPGGSHVPQGLRQGQVQHHYIDGVYVDGYLPERAVHVIQ